MTPTPPEPTKEDRELAEKIRDKCLWTTERSWALRMDLMIELVTATTSPLREQLSEAKKEVEGLKQTETEHEQAFIERLCRELDERGIDTSDWDGEDAPETILTNAIIGLRDQAVENDRDRITTLERVLRECEKALNEDALWAFDNKPPTELEARWTDGTGSLTAGPNNCRNFFNARKQALVSIASLGLGKEDRK